MLREKRGEILSLGRQLLLKPPEKEEEKMATSLAKYSAARQAHSPIRLNKTSFFLLLSPVLSGMSSLHQGSV